MTHCPPLARWLARGLVASALGMAVFAPPAGGQVPPRPRPDSLSRPDTATRDTIPRDTVRARIDSIEAEDRALIARQRRLADTLKAPLARAEAVATPAIGPGWTWDRDSVAASGALTLGELVDRVPGITGFRTGWIGSPHLLAYLGAFGKVRAFFDGVELEPLDARSPGLLDFSFVETWPLEDARIEHGADEVRVHLRSWRVRSTTPVTRVDVHTGDLETNAYTGFYGRRLDRGQALQLGARQYSSTDVRLGGDADQTALWGRLGWAGGPWSVDASVLRTSRERAEQPSELQNLTLPKLDGVFTVAYARVAWGDPDADGMWAQGTAATQKFVIRSPPKMVVDSVEGPDGGGPRGSPDQPDTLYLKTDTVQSQPQYVVSGGLTRGPWRLSAASRIRAVGGRTFVAPSLRAALDLPRLSAAAYVERSPAHNLLRAEVSGRLLVLPVLALAGSVARSAPIAAGSLPTTMALRGEAGVRLGGMWVSGGVMTRDTSFSPAPAVFDTTYRPASAGNTTATFVTLRGKFYRDLGLDVVAVKHADPGPYRPQYQTRSRLYFDSDMRSRFPSGNLHILFAVTHDYRTQLLFPTASGVRESSQYRTWGLQLEIRLLTATLTWQFRNVMNAEYAQVPGFTMPRPVNYYGVRWYFFN